MFAAVFFVALAGFCFCSLGPVGFFAAVANTGLFFGDLSFFRLAQASVGERMSASAALFLRERAQHDS